MKKATLKSIPTSHQWLGDEVSFISSAKRGERQQYRPVKLDFKKIGVARGGLLEQCINDTRCPIHSSDAYIITSALHALTEHRQIRNILSAPPYILDQSDIIKLLAEVDKHYTEQPGTSAGASAEKVRNFFSGCRKPLRNDVMIPQAGYVPTLKPPLRKPRRDISDRVDNSFESSELAMPASAISRNSLRKLDKQAEIHYRERLDKIVQTCMKVLDEHDKIKHCIASAKLTCLPSSFQSRTKILLENKGRCDWKVMMRRSPDERLRIALFQVEYHRLYEHAPSGNQINIEDIEDLDALAGTSGARTRFGVLLSEYYLSRFVVTACYIILLRYTMWNADTLISLTADRLRRTPHGFEITGFKGKTGQYQTAQVTANDESVFIEESAAIRAIELLLAHDRNVSLYAKRDSNSIFVSMRLSYSYILEFDVFLHGKHFHEFTRTWNLPRFTASDIRTQAVRHADLKNNKNTHLAQVQLGHADASLTIQYLSGSVDHYLNEANIKRYMDLYAHSVFFITGRRAIPKNISSDDSSVIKRLLFPPTRFSDGNVEYLIDKWLSSSGTLKISVGVEEVQHCVYQRKYYLQNLHALRDANHERFAKYELPRIVACCALYNLIQNSPLKKVLKKYEEALNA